MCVYVWPCLNEHLAKNISDSLIQVYIAYYYIIIQVYMHTDCANLAQNVTVSVASSQVEWCVVSAVHHVDAGSSHNEHVHHIGASLPTRPVQWTESVIISKTQTKRSLKISS